MVFHIVAVGRVRNSGFSTACDDYVGRVRHYTKLHIHEVPDGSRRSKSPKVILHEEAEALLEAAPSNARLVAVARGGCQLDSRAFAAKLDKLLPIQQQVQRLSRGVSTLDDDTCRPQISDF